MRLIFGMMVLAIAACGGRNVQIDRFNESLSIWKRLSMDHRNTYQYTRTHGLLMFSRVTGVMTFGVDNGQVTLRSYKNEGLLDPKYPDYTETWSQVGTHNYFEPPQTIDELYTECKDKVISKIGDSTYKSVRFETDDQGILKHCRHDRVNPLADDFGYSILINSFQWN